jgi:hypothetical protein
MRELASIAACAIVALSCPRPSRGDDNGAKPAPASEAECEAAFHHALELANHGRLQAARDDLQTCESTACGEVVRHRCMLRSELIAADLPTVVLSVTDDDDAPIGDVRVLADGRLLTSQIDGVALPLDPGIHELAFSRGETVFATKKLVVLQGQRNRIIAVRYHAARAAAAARVEASPVRAELRATTTGRASYLPSYLTLGVGAAAIGGAALLTMWGRGDNDRLAECAPSCPQASVDHIHRLYLAADISLGVGVAAVAVGSWLAWRTHSHHAITVQPIASGAVASISGAL